MPIAIRNRVGVLPAGKYYVGDPCYVLRDDARWRAFSYAMDKASDGGLSACILEFEGAQCFCSPTNCGDGVYYDQNGHAYGVDTGQIAVLPEAVAGGPDWGGRGPIALVRGFVFYKPFQVGATPGRWLKNAKTIYIGEMRIRT